MSASSGSESPRLRAAYFSTDPIAGPVPRSPLARALWRGKHRLRALLGVRRGFRVEGFYYKETSPVLLSKALSRRGTGEKEYRVTFPDGAKMLLRCSLRRPIADIMGPVVLPHYQRAQSMIRPGMRVVSLPCGTGNAAAWLAERVGPSGAVVALDPDAETIAYAGRRYPRANVAFEVGGAPALLGEIDGSFDAGFVVQLDPDRFDPELIREVWRVVAPGGWMLVAASTDVPRGALDEAIRTLPPTPSAPPPSSHEPVTRAAPTDTPADLPLPPQADWLARDDEAMHVVIVRKLAP